MRILPITNNHSRKNNPSFQAINQKYYEWGKKHIEKYQEIPSNLLYCLQADVLAFKSVKPQDGLDTIRALRELLKPKKDEWANELVGDFKQLAREERSAARRALKKLNKTKK